MYIKHAMYIKLMWLFSVKIPTKKKILDICQLYSATIKLYIEGITAFSIQTISCNKNAIPTN